MFNAYDAECCVCKGMKRVMVQERVEVDEGMKPITTSIRSEAWGYAPGEHETAIEGFCPECGLKFIYPYSFF